jgi:CubicO group peptidase (beta-lactamase class C family)
MTDARLPEGINGTCDKRFAPVAALLAQQLATGEHHGVAFAGCFRGEPVVDIWGGSRRTAAGESHWERDTMAICWSTTKGVAATALHIAMDRKGVDLQAPVASVWSEFGRNGKDAITIAQALSHEAGVPQIRDQVADYTDLADWDARVEMMENLTPLWEPGTANGYHAINFAWLAGELLHRIDGRDVSTFLAEEIAGPLGLDGLYIGTPSSEHHRIAHIISATDGLEIFPGEQFDELLPHDSVVWKALSPRGNGNEFFNTPQGMSACIPSISGSFTARSLARLYAVMERGGELEGRRLLSAERIARATSVQNTRGDLVMVIAPHWRAGYMGAGSEAVRSLGPHADGYGHVGAGGTLAGVDPVAEVSFGLVYDLFGSTELIGGPRSTAMVDALVAAAEAAG